MFLPFVFDNFHRVFLKKAPEDLIWFFALVAQLDRVLDYESSGREFESSPARHFPLLQTNGVQPNGPPNGY